MSSLLPWPSLTFAEPRPVEQLWTARLANIHKVRMAAGEPQTCWVHSQCRRRLAPRRRFPRDPLPAPPTAAPSPPLSTRRGGLMVHFAGELGVHAFDCS